MKKNSLRPDLGNCPVCEQGLVHIARCPLCDDWSAVCDDCEAIWSKPSLVFRSRPDSQHPECPHCQGMVPRWNFGTRKQLHDAGFGHLLEGHTD